MKFNALESNANIYIASYLYENGFDEDGSQVYGERFFLRLDMEDGRRFDHNFSSDDVVRIEKLMESVKGAKGVVDLDHWCETDPVYGSPAYQKLDNIGYFYQNEREAEGFY